MIKGFTIAAAALTALLAAATPAQAVRTCNPDETCVSTNSTSTKGITINGTHTGASIAHVVLSGSGERAVATFTVSAVTLADGNIVAVN